MTPQPDSESSARRMAGRRRWLRAGLWFVIAEIAGTLLISRVAADAAGVWVWIALLVPCAAYLACLWRLWRCPVCHESLVVDAGPYQRTVFKLSLDRCPRCGASLS